MMVLIVYDVETVTSVGRKRLSKVAKICSNYGQRVQNSVFECLLTPSQLIEMQKQLEAIADQSADSLRYYNLGNKWQTRIKRFGRCGNKSFAEYDPQGPLIL
jgi:CRISPR-associated protein Cas2